MISKCLDHCPLARQLRIFARQGVALSRRTLCDWVRDASESLAVLMPALQRHVLASPVIFTDDTTLALQAPGKTITARMWVHLAGGQTKDREAQGRRWLRAGDATGGDLKNWLSAGSPLGGRAAAVALSLIETARLNGIEPYAYLKDVLTRLPGHRMDRLDELLPMNWKPAPRWIPPPSKPSTAQARSNCSTFRA